VPRLPGAAVQPASLVVLTVLAAALVVVGLIGFRRRAIG
jgi:putative exporter of polyketide antibiotics